jgi:hypothetical protein
MAANSAVFDRHTLEAALERLGEIAVEHGKLIEISVYGGSAIMLTFPSRVATRDVDAVFLNDAKFVRDAALQVGEELGLDPGWINDGVQEFLSARDTDPDVKSLFRTYPQVGDRAGLRVFVASPAYLFAMKCMAMRLSGSDGNQDAADIKLLGAALGITTYQAALSLISDYYPDGRIAPKTQFGLMEIFGESHEKDE